MAGRIRPRYRYGKGKVIQNKVVGLGRARVKWGCCRTQTVWEQVR